MMRVLNLYAGLGGNRQKWGGVEVTAVEMEPDIAEVYQANNPDDTVVIGDAHEYLLANYDKFDFIWSSPPCPTHSRMAKATRHDFRQYPDMKLYQEILFLQHFFKGQWVVENVKSYYDPMIKPQEMSRHYFWSDFQIPILEVKSPEGFIGTGKGTKTPSTQDLKDWLDIQYEGNIYYKGNHCPNQVLRNCVHPDLGLHVFESAKSINPTTVDQLSFL
jgi:DNA (cytosine-5)-methyltransferase 1